MSGLAHLCALAALHWRRDPECAPLFSSRNLRFGLLVSVCLAMVLAIGMTAPLGAREPNPAQERLKAWSEGPIRWLLLSRERKQMSHLRTLGEVTAFIDIFWTRRDPEPGKPGNSFQDEFEERVRAADKLYGEPGKRGSLTDRGHALILLGAPGYMRIYSKPGITWNPKGRSPHSVGSRMVELEMWSYAPDELPRRMLETLSEEKRNVGLSLTFVREEGGAKLSSGEDHLRQAARSAVGRLR